MPGEPGFNVAVAVVREVYPRACGGTALNYTRELGEAGLSPRVRGNQRAGGHQPEVEGSIPARAGEPSWRCPRSTSTKVYPRACRGNPCACADDECCSDLSPRVPGEPSPPRAVRCAAPVYPRACGGTGAPCSARPSATGLSLRSH